MRISDWSSDVCSSDLVLVALRHRLDAHGDDDDRQHGDGDHQHAEAGNCEVHSCLLPPLKTLAKTPALPARIPACFRNGKGRQALIYPVRWQRGKSWLRCVAVAEFGQNAADMSPPGYDGLTNLKCPIGTIHSDGLVPSRDIREIGREHV